MSKCDYGCHSLRAEDKLTEFIHTYETLCCFFTALTFMKIIVMYLKGFHNTKYQCQNA